jgi:hypothetical protein
LNGKCLIGKLISKQQTSVIFQLLGSNYPVHHLDR